MDRPDVDLPPDTVPTTVDLPPAAVIDAGVAKFVEMANLHWPKSPKDGFRLVSFDIKDSHQLRMALGLTYMAMRGADDERSNPGRDR